MVVGTTMVPSTSLEAFVPPSPDDHYDMLFTMPELEAALSSCRRPSAPGPDGISYASLSHLGMEGRTVLLSYYNDTWASGIVPEHWKISRLVALLKPGKPPYELTSYRPVALASCVGKVMERMVLARLEWFLEQNALYPDMMTGFRRGRSSIDSVIDLISTVEHEKRSRRLVAAVFLDIKGAYDNVLHDAILDALDDIGVGGRMYSWIGSYLNGRSVYMSTPDGETTRHQVCRGVPQGGVLSPTLFNVALIGLVNELPTNIHISAYADDICIWASGSTRPQMRARLQRAVSSTSRYLRRQGLHLAAEKCAVVAFTRKSVCHYPVTLQGVAIPYVSHHRFLGIIIDRDLSWSRHINMLKKRLTLFCHVLRFVAGIKWGPTERSLLRLYYTLFIGYIRYSLPVLSNMSISCLRTLESVQAQALKICLGLPRFLHAHCASIAPNCHQTMPCRIIPCSPHG
ncbi:hypothetical protein V5799_013642 [Amblyomma americanum]|uniref:Reverse transcriptase domain-containing protein n=1 Tax=Amblyomma americanum TaxID=6943 RepID=A0AAQ4E5B0_AMBAM